MSRADTTDWRSAASCVETDPEAFFPGQGQDAVFARRVCAGCDVRDECLDWAMDHADVSGVWGGTTERQRRAMRRGGR